MRFTQVLAPVAGLFSLASAAAYGPEGIAYTTVVTTAYETYCPLPTTFGYKNVTYTVTEPKTVTISNCPCTIIETHPAPITTTSVWCPTPSHPAGNHTIYPPPKTTTSIYTIVPPPQTHISGVTPVTSKPPATSKPLVTPVINHPTAVPVPPTVVPVPPTTTGPAQVPEAAAGKIGVSFCGAVVAGVLAFFL
ncbi:hypothetical protein HYQ45_010409 [Verticillium longisporum]|uniref:Cell wall protein SED1 n=1 Tax=Verticillium longisporum TaxID=100787 RepID=A0A0G4KUH1_VERLO|nr:hypothetical protein HYQ44_011894 [Verticillium longisporum]KAG7130866.1 hypothetical protein HYQ45_010409 [Verticillium longisporum]CRK13311.1 hypothetical protein BN1708_010759 [Verticillium longisporum]